MKHLNNLAVEHLLDRRWSDVIECVEAAFLDSTADMVPKIYLASGNNEGGDFRAMPAALGDFIGLKWIGVFPNNSKNNLPTTIGTYLLNDRWSGQPLLAMDCTTLTAFRTAATSAIAAKYCAPEKVQEVAFIGCGKQAYYHACAYKSVFGKFKVSLSDKNMDTAVKLASSLKSLGLTDIKFHHDIKDAVREAEIITTLTPSTKAYLNIIDVPNNCHINAVGADAVGKRELMTNVIDGAADVFCDDPEQAFHSGELQYNEWPHLPVDSLSDLIENHKSMQLNKGVSVFDSTGVAIEDIAVAVLVWDLEMFCDES